VADRRVTLAVTAAFIAFLAGCATQVAVPPEAREREPAEFPSAYYRRLLAQGTPVFRVDPTRSLVVIEVRRGGSLARFGHDHVVASHDTSGSIAPDEGRADLWVPLDTLVVDERALRDEAGFDTQPSPDDIAGTRRNMLEKVLQTDQYPHALIAVNEIGNGDGVRQLRLAITLHGNTQSFDTEAQFERTAKDVSVTGSVAVEQSRFGIVPLSVLGGAIAVQDRVNIKFRVVARQMQQPAGSGSSTR
jgi:hypothetical protein